MPNVLRLARTSFAPARPRDQRSSTAPTAKAESGEVVDLCGISTAELSPRVQLALTQLAIETQDLRRALMTARTRIHDLENLADHDPLTPTLNRRAFIRELERHRALIARHGGETCLLFADVDGLKAINDRFGHAVGDKALLWIADILQAALRQGDVVGRLGGDEFGILLPACSCQQASAMAERLAALLAQRPLELEGLHLTLSCSFGCAALRDRDPAKSVLAAADRAMYQAKQTRR